jgi:CheY-like chemotaxis protein
MPTILIVDDDPMYLLPLRLFFEGQGRWILTARDGEEGFRKAVQFLPSLIITDLNMPVMDGALLCKHLSLYPGLAQIPVILTSGQQPPQSTVKLWTLFLKKPVDLKVLEHKVNALLEDRFRYAPARPHRGTEPRVRWACSPKRYWV